MANIDVSKYNTLGIFYQEPLTVRYGAAEGSKDPKVYAPNTSGKMWGFRFLFNPTSWSYSLSVNTTVDWTRPNGDATAPAILAATGIGGNLSITILLDRVADMNTMRKWWKRGRINPPGPPLYPYTLSDEQCLGILHRGTEYDLEYLFRVINGDPQETAMVGTGPEGYDSKSANLGYVAGSPFMFKIHNNQKYRVMCSNLSVQHDMFTREMIPIRSLVTVSLERIPDFASTDASQNLDKFTDIALGVDAQNTTSSTSRTVRGGSERFGVIAL